MVIAFQSVVVLSVLLGVTYLVRLTRSYDLTAGGTVRVDRFAVGPARRPGPRDGHTLDGYPLDGHFPAGYPNGEGEAVTGSPDDRLRLGLAVPSNGQACGPD